MKTIGQTNWTPAFAGVTILKIESQIVFHGP